MTNKKRLFKKSQNLPTFRHVSKKHNIANKKVRNSWKYFYMKVLKKIKKNETFYMLLIQFSLLKSFFFYAFGSMLLWMKLQPPISSVGFWYCSKTGGCCLLALKLKPRSITRTCQYVLLSVNIIKTFFLLFKICIDIKDKIF